MLPFQSHFNVFTSNDPVLDSWKGARKWAMSPDCDELSITRKDYEEKGAGYIKEHMVTNQYFVTPAASTLVENDSINSLHKSESQSSLA